MQVENTRIENSPPKPHRCPWWFGWALTLPMRRWWENPSTLLQPFVDQGQRVLEVGPGMGFFTPTLAQRVGEVGKVICVDVQPQMLSGLRKRLQRQGLEARVEIRSCTDHDLCISDLAGTLDRALLAYVLHELHDPLGAFRAIFEALRPGGKLLLVEPKGHVTPTEFSAQLALARDAGFMLDSAPSGHWGSRVMVQLLSRD